MPQNNVYRKIRVLNRLQAGGNGRNEAALRRHSVVASVQVVVGGPGEWLWAAVRAGGRRQGYSSMVGQFG